MKTITWSDFEQIELVVGTVVRVEEFPKARNPSYKLWVDFGENIGELKSSAQITSIYECDKLVGKQIIGVVNFPDKQIGPFLSQCLITGFKGEDGVVLAVPERVVPNGSKLC